MMGSTDSQRVEFLPKVFHGKRCRFAGRGSSSRTPANSGILGKAQRVRRYKLI
jgi:hypothetical protein